MSRNPDDRGLNRIAIAVGLSVSLIAMLVGVVAVLLAQVVMSSARGEAVRNGDFDLWATEPVLLLTLVAQEAGCNAFGGYVAGRMATNRVVRHSAWVGVLFLPIGVLSTVAPDEGPSAPFWSDALSILLTVPAAIGGGWLAQRHRSRGQRSV